MESHVCRICLAPASRQRPLYKRCNCAHFHDSCFNDWLRHRNCETCEVCGANYEGIRRVEIDVVLVNLQRQAWFWLGIYTLVTIMVWLLKCLVEEYSRCIYAARAAGRPEASCKEWSAIKELLIVICCVSSAAILLQALASCVCPSASGLVISKRRSRLTVVPGQARLPSANMVIEV